MELSKYTELKLKVTGYEKKDGVSGTYFHLTNAGDKPLYNNVRDKEVNGLIIHTTRGLSETTEYEIYDVDQPVKAMSDALDIEEVKIFFNCEYDFNDAIKKELEDFCKKEMIPCEFMDDDYDMGLPLPLERIFDEIEEGKSDGEFLKSYKIQSFKWQVKGGNIRFYDNGLIEPVCKKISPKDFNKSIMDAYDEFVKKWNKEIVGKYDYNDLYK